MNTNNQKTTIAGDDLLWVQYDVEWQLTGPHINDDATVRGLIKSPTNFIAAHNIKVMKNGALVTPTVPKRFEILFKSIKFGVPAPVGVQGIDNSSVITVRPDTALGVVDLRAKIPIASPILVTMVQDAQRAYIHWEVSNEGPGVPTTPTELVNHLEASILFPQGYEAEYARRLDKLRINAQVVFVNNNGGPIDPQPLSVAIKVQYANGRDVMLESEDNILQERPGIVSCNVDIGNYYIDPEDGHIVVVVDSTIVKVY